MAIEIRQLLVTAEGDASSYVNAMTQKAAADEKAIASGKRLDDSVALTTRRLGDSATGFERFTRSIDPAYSAQQKLSTGTARLQSALDAGRITTERHAELLRLLQQRYSALQAPQDAVVATNGRVTVSTGSVRFAMQNLGFQLNDIGTQLASGTSPFRIMAQQSGQVIQAFQAGGGFSKMMGAIGTAIANWVTPTKAVVAGVLAIGGVLLTLISRASATEERLRSLDTILIGMGTRSNVTASGLDSVIKHLRETGTAADEATKAVQAFARVPGINPASAATLLPLARDIATVRGEDLSSVGTKMAAAFADGTEAAIKLAQALGGPNALSVQQIKAAQGMAALGDRAGAARIILAALQQQFGGSFERSLSDSAKAINSISSAWANMLDNLSRLGAVQGARDAVIAMLNSISRAATTPAGLPTGTDPVSEGNRARYLYGAPPMSPAEEAKVRQQTMGQSNVPGGAISSAALGTANVGALNPEFYSRINDWMSALPEQERALLSITSAYRDAGKQADLFAASDGSGRMVAAPGGSAHNFGVGADIRGMSPQARDSLSVYGLHTPMSWEPWHVEPRETPLADRSSAIQRRASFEQFNTAYGSGVFGSAGAASDAGPANPAGVPTGLNQAQQSAIQDQITFNQKLVDTTKMVGESAVYWRAYWQALGSGTKDQVDIERATVAAQGAVSQWRAELEKSNETARLTNQLGLETAKAYGTDLVSGLTAAAQAEAELAVREGRAVSISAERQRILETSAIAAIRSGREQLAASLPQIDAMEKLAAATSQGAAAAHEQELQNQASAATQDALAKAEASRNPELIKQAKALTDAALAEVKRTDAARQAQATYALINQRNDQIAVSQLATSMVGQRPEDIAAATEHLREQQRLLNSGEKLTSEIARNDLANVDALSAANAQWAEAVRRQQGLEESIRSIVDIIGNDLTRSIEDAFSGTKVQTWGERIKSMLGSLSSTISSSLFIKPLIGTGLGAAGFPNLASQYGSFGNLFGGGGSSGGSGAAAAGTGSVFGGGSIFSVLSGASSLNSSGGGTFASTDSFFNKIGSSLGFGGGGVFGSTTLGQALGGAGAGFGAGSLLNSLIGGNTTTGSIGSGVGGLAGSLIGSMFGFPMLGGIAGGLLGSLGGLIGPKPSVFSSGGAVNLSTGTLGGFSSSGNSENDSIVRQIASSIGQFATAIQKSSGGTINPTAYIAPVASTEGIRLDYSLVNRGTGSLNVGSAEEGVRISELAIARELTGVSDTVKKVIDSVSNPDDLQAAIEFANAYDKLGDSLKSALASLPGEIGQEGPFAQAKDQITAAFDEISAGAAKLGLSLDPVNAALAEASRRLTDDFNRSISDTLLALNNPTAATVETLNRTQATRTAEATAVGGDLTQVAALNAAEFAQLTDSFQQAVNQMNRSDLANQVQALIQTQKQMQQQGGTLGIWDWTGVNLGAENQLVNILKGNTAESIQAVLDAVTGLDPEMTKLAEALLATAKATEAATSAQTAALDPLKSLLADLTAGNLSGRPESDLAAAANDNFQKLIAQVYSGNLDQVQPAAAAGQAAIGYATTAYGNAPQTAALRDSIVNAINQALAARGFASGGETQPGWNLYGEKGPEWLYSPSRVIALPHGVSPPDAAAPHGASQPASRNGDPNWRDSPASVTALSNRRSSPPTTGNDVAVASAVSPPNVTHSSNITHSSNVTYLSNIVHSSTHTLSAGSPLAAGGNDAGYTPRVVHSPGLTTESGRPERRNLPSRALTIAASAAHPQVTIAGRAAHPSSAAHPNPVAVAGIEHRSSADQSSMARPVIGPATLEARSFAGGGEAQPGWNLYGERGPEWLYSPGPVTALPHGVSPDRGVPAGAALSHGVSSPTTVGNAALIAEIKALRTELTRLQSAGNKIAQDVGEQLVKSLSARIGSLASALPAQNLWRKVA